MDGSADFVAVAPPQLWWKAVDDSPTDYSPKPAQSDGPRLNKHYRADDSLAVELVVRLVDPRYTSRQ